MRACWRSAAGSAAAAITKSTFCSRCWATPLKPSIHMVHMGHGVVCSITLGQRILQPPGCSIDETEPTVGDTPDTIERELILPVPRAQVWAALTEPAALSAWFGTSASVDLRPGGAVTFEWDGSTGPRGTNQGVIEVV